MSKAKIALCPGGPLDVWQHNPHPVHWTEAREGVRPTGIKRLRVVCPRCGRRLLSSVAVCDDGCGVLHSIPPHKPRGWWKKAGHPHEQRQGSYRRGRGRGTQHGGR